MINSPSITVVTITKTICPPEDRVPDIKSAHVGDHVRKGEILAEFLKTHVPMGKHPDRRHLRVFKFSIKSVN